MIQIVYTGTIYAGKEKPEVLFQALRELLDERKISNSDFGVSIYGDTEAWINKEVERYGLVGIVKQCGRVEHERAIEIQNTADILWLIKWDGVIRGSGRQEKFLCWLFRDKEGAEYLREFDGKFAGRSETGVTPQKFFEYMGTGRFILATGGCKDEVSKIIEETYCGADCSKVEEIKEFLVVCLKTY